VTEQEAGFANTDRLFELFSVPKDVRDEKWKDDFFAAFPDATLRFASEEQVRLEADGLPYAQLSLPLPGEPFQALTLRELLPWVTETGIGVVLYDPDGEPGWVLTYGQMWSFQEFGQFELPLEEAATGEELQTENPDDVMIYHPTEEFLPIYVRKQIRHFMVEALQVDGEPTMLVMFQAQPKPTTSLVFSLFAEDFPSEEEFMNILYVMSWFVPTNYAIAGISKESPLVKEMLPVLVAG
jgi:hypothetical protein